MMFISSMRKRPHNAIYYRAKPSAIAYSIDRVYPSLGWQSLNTSTGRGPIVPSVWFGSCVFLTMRVVCFLGPQDLYSTGRHSVSGLGFPSQHFHAFSRARFAPQVVIPVVSAGTSITYTMQDFNPWVYDTTFDKAIMQAYNRVKMRLVGDVNAKDHAKLNFRDK